MKITASNTQQLINQNLAKVEKNSTRESPRIPKVFRFRSG